MKAIARSLFIFWMLGTFHAAPADSQKPGRECKLPVGASLNVSSTPLTLAQLGSSAARIGPEEQQQIALGDGVRFHWGLSLAATAAREFADFDSAGMPIHSRSSGCWFTWENVWGEPAEGVKAISNVRVSAGGTTTARETPVSADVPAIKGAFVGARSVQSPKYKWVGLWTSPTGSMVIAFQGEQQRVLARLPFRASAMEAFNSPDTAHTALVLIAPGGTIGTTIYFQLLWDTNR